MKKRRNDERIGSNIPNNIKLSKVNGELDVAVCVFLASFVVVVVVAPRVEGCFVIHWQFQTKRLKTFNNTDINKNTQKKTILAKKSTEQNFLQPTHTPF